jgi:hypothetical protein
MNILHAIILVVLCVIILGGVSVNSNVQSMVGSVPGMIIILSTIFYLFSVSPILGIFALIAGYELVVNTQSNKTSKILNDVSNEIPNEYSITSMNQFPVTLEETIVKNIVPLVQTTTPPHLNLKYTQDNTYSAANSIN